MELLEKHNINFIVLARYMQVISEQMIEASVRSSQTKRKSFLTDFKLHIACVQVCIGLAHS